MILSYSAWHFCPPKLDFGRRGCQAGVAVSRIFLSQFWNDSRFHILDEPFAINAGQDIV